MEKIGLDKKVFTEMIKSILDTGVCLYYTGKTTLKYDFESTLSLSIVFEGKKYKKIQVGLFVNPREHQKFPNTAIIIPRSVKITRMFEEDGIFKVYCALRKYEVMKIYDINREFINTVMQNNIVDYRTYYYMSKAVIYDEVDNKKYITTQDKRYKLITASKIHTKLLDGSLAYKIVSDHMIDDSSIISDMLLFYSIVKKLNSQEIHLSDDIKSMSFIYNSIHLGKALEFNVPSIKNIINFKSDLTRAKNFEIMIRNTIKYLEIVKESLRDTDDHKMIERLALAIDKGSYILINDMIDLED